MKIYLPEPGRDELDAALTGREDLVISDLGITEIISALARRRREVNLGIELASRLHGRILDDVEGGQYEVILLLPSVHREAERLLLALEEKPLRAADALYLALVIAAGARSAVTFDQRLAEAARRIGVSAVRCQLRTGLSNSRKGIPTWLGNKHTGRRTDADLR